MSEPFLGEIRIFSANFPPKGWAFCDGQLLPITQNTALFSLLGTTYGGDGRTNFALPNLQGRSAVHASSGLQIGESGGAEKVTLVAANLAGHTHQTQGSAALATTNRPTGNYPAIGNSYSSNEPVGGGPTTATGTPSPESHENRDPYLALSFIIALQGIFPAQN